MPGTVQQMKAHHTGAGAVLHALHSARRLVDAPVAFACDKDRRHVDGAAVRRSAAAQLFTDGWFNFAKSGVQRRALHLGPKNGDVVRINQRSRVVDQYG